MLSNLHPFFSLKTADCTPITTVRCPALCICYGCARKEHKIYSIVISVITVCHFNQSIFASVDFMRTISKETYDDLSICNGQLFATHQDFWDSYEIHMYDCKTCKQLRTIILPCSDPRYSIDEYWHPICAYSTHISLSCCDINRIFILDIDAKVKQSHRPEISITIRQNSSSNEENMQEDIILNGPYIYQMSDDGAMLVADRWNDRLLMLTATGQWRRIEPGDELRRPNDAVWWRGRLYVSTRAEIKLTVLQWMIRQTWGHLFCVIGFRTCNMLYNNSAKNIYAFTWCVQCLKMIKWQFYQKRTTNHWFIYNVYNAGILDKNFNETFSFKLENIENNNHGKHIVV